MGSDVGRLTDAHELTGVSTLTVGRVVAVGRVTAGSRATMGDTTWVSTAMVEGVGGVGARVALDALRVVASSVTTSCSGTT